MNRRVPPVAVMLILHIHCIAEPIRATPANEQWLHTFFLEELIHADRTSGSGYSCTGKGLAWAERILGALPPRGYGGEGKFYKIGSLDNAYTNVETARLDAMHMVKGAHQASPWREGAYILKAIELLEPVRPESEFQTTYLS